MKNSLFIYFFWQKSYKVAGTACSDFTIMVRKADEHRILKSEPTLGAEFWSENELKSVITSGVVVVVVVVVEAVVVGIPPLFLSWAKIRHENPVAVFLPLLRNFAMILNLKNKVAIFVDKCSEKIRTKGATRILLFRIQLSIF